MPHSSLSPKVSMSISTSSQNHDCGLGSTTGFPTTEAVRRPPPRFLGSGLRPPPRFLSLEKKRENQKSVSVMVGKAINKSSIVRSVLESDHPGDEPFILILITRDSG